MGHIFISYSHRDGKYAHELADNLQSMGFNVWIDARLDYGSHWPLEIQKQLDSCEAFILVMTPRSYASEWVQSELQRAKRKLKPIFPVLLEGDEPWLSVESTQFYDVRGGKLPDEKFYSAIKQVVPIDRSAQTLHGPNTTTPSKPVSTSPKFKGGILLACLGVLSIICVAAVVLIWFKLSTNPGLLPEAPVTSSPDVEPTLVPTALVVSTEPALENEITDEVGAKMALVPEGKFMMGSDNNLDDEKPAHTVYLDAFYIDKYEVTNGLYMVCVDAGVCQPPKKTSSTTHSSYYGNSEFDDYPVIYIDWDMAVTYCKWRGAYLPTEAQWEKAARGTDGRTYPWGEGIDNTYANYDLNIGDTTAVGSYESGQSPYGVYDMAGNVWEWVTDWYSETYYTGAPLTNPLGPDAGEYRVLRGGSWLNDKDIVRTSNRGWNQLEYFDHTDFGFRCARAVTP